jgi:hypothetical protein
MRTAPRRLWGPCLAAACALAAAPLAFASAGAPGLAVPLYAASNPCDDPRYPTLAGAWVLACGADGHVDRAISLSSGRELSLPAAFRSPGVGPDAVYVPDAGGGLWRLTEAGVQVVPGVSRVIEPAVAPAVTDGEHLVVASRKSLQAFPFGDRSRSVYPANPVGWQSPALAWPRVAWVEDAGPDGTDVWLRWADRRADPELLAGGPGDQGRVVAQGAWLAWVDKGDVVVHNLDTGERSEHQANTGFSAPPALWAGEVCWESRQNTDGVDIECTDLPGAGGPGHQLWPSRWGPWLLYREGHRAMLYTRPLDPE